MTKQELRFKLGQAKTPQERHGLLMQYRKCTAINKSARDRYKGMERFIRVMRNISEPETSA